MAHMDDNPFYQSKEWGKMLGEWTEQQAMAEALRNDPSLFDKESDQFKESLGSTLDNYYTGEGAFAEEGAPSLSDPGPPASVMPQQAPPWGGGPNSDFYSGQLQNLMAQRARYYQNTSPNLGGPALGQGESDLQIPETPSRQQEYIDPVSGQPIDLNPATGFEAAPVQGVRTGYTYGGNF